MGFVKKDNIPNPDKPGIYHDVDDKLNGIGFDKLEEFSLGNWDEYKSKNIQYWISLGTIPFGWDTRQNDILGLQNPYPSNQNLPSLPQVQEGFEYGDDMGNDFFRDTWIKSDTEMFAISKNKIHHYIKTAGAVWDSSNLTEEYAFDVVDEFYNTRTRTASNVHDTNVLHLNTVLTSFTFSDDGNKLFVLVETIDGWGMGMFTGPLAVKQWHILQIPFDNFLPPTTPMIETCWIESLVYMGDDGHGLTYEDYPWVKPETTNKDTADPPTVNWPAVGNIYPSKPHKIKFGDGGNKLYLLCGGSRHPHVDSAVSYDFADKWDYACNADGTIIQFDLDSPYDLNRNGNPSLDFLDIEDIHDNGDPDDTISLGFALKIEKMNPSAFNTDYGYDVYAFPDWQNVLNRHFPLMIFEQDNEMFDAPLWYSTSGMFITTKEIPEEASVDNYHFTYESFLEGDFIAAKFLGRTPVDFNFNDDGTTFNVLFASKYTIASLDNEFVDEFGLCSFKLKTPWVVNYNHNFGVNSTDDMYGGWQWWTDKNWVFSKRQEIYQEILDWDRPYLDIAMQDATIEGSGYTTTNTPVLKYDYAGLDALSYGGVYPPTISSDIRVSTSELLFDFFDDTLQLFDVYPSSNLIKTYIGNTPYEPAKLGSNLNFPFYDRKNTYAVDHQPATYVVNVVNSAEEPFLNHNITSSVYMETSYPVEVNLNVDLYIDGSIASYPNTLSSEITYHTHFPDVAHIQTFLGNPNSVSVVNQIDVQDCVYRYYVQEWGDEEEVSKDNQLEDYYSEFFISGSREMGEYDTKIFVLNQIDSKPIQNISKHIYTTSGIKRIKLILYRYTSDQEFLVELSLLTKNIVINDGNITAQDFEIFGGTDFNYLPLIDNQVIIGGLSEDSKYIISSKKIKDNDLYSKDDYLSKSTTDNFIKKYNDGMFGKDPGKIDLGTMRNFRGVKRLGDMTGSFHATGSENDNSLITNIFIDKIDNNFKRDTTLELNSQKRDFHSLQNTIGTNKTAVLIGDYELEKKKEENPIRKKGFMNPPQIDKDIDKQAV